jgi:putative ABC transport system permease protein
MFRNYFKTSFRSLRRNWNYSMINIAGLAAGIAVCLILFVIIQFERSFDNFHSKKDRIYRVLTEYHHADAAEIFYGDAVPFGLPGSLQTEFPELEKVAPIYSAGNDQILVPNENGEAVKKFKEQKGVFFTNPSFFNIFDFQWLAGDPLKALKDLNSAVLTKEIAQKYFGDWKKAMGKTIKWNNNLSLRITGILGTIPKNTDFGLKVVISYGSGYTADFAKSTNWEGTRGGFGCYILFPDRLSVSNFNTRLRAFSKKMEPAEDKDSHIIESLAAVHFDTHISNFSGKSISPELIRALWLIGAFILLIACVNFINLSTAQAVNRAREVGVRKVLGSNKSQLKMQFFSETLMIVITAVVLAVLIAMLVLPVMGNILDLPLSTGMLINPQVFIFLFFMACIVTLLAGFYPSLVLSGFNPINALKSRFQGPSASGISLRRGLVIFQFIIAQALIIGTLIMIKQMNYFTNRPLGFDKEAIINIPFPEDSVGLSKLDFLKKQLADLRGIRNTSFNSNTPVEDDNDNWTTFRYNHAIKETDFYAIIKWADNQYLPVYRLPLIAGRNLTPSDTAKEFLVDEQLVKKLGIKNPEDILNKEICLWGGEIKGPVVGVLKEYNARSLRRDLAPVLITSMKRGYSSASIKLSTTDISATMLSIEKLWNNAFPDFVFEYQFLDRKIENFYKQEKQLSLLYQIFAMIAIFLSCLGLYGLASFMAVQRIKEVGIRKVLGASAGHIVYLFSKEFILLIGIAFAIAAPIAWYFMNKWLQDYPYRIEISWWIFLIGGLSSVLIALVTVSFQAIRAAVTNPVQSLRTE